jgi:hypothetical protein
VRKVSEIIDEPVGEIKVRQRGAISIYPFESLKVGETFYVYMVEKDGKLKRPFATIYSSRRHWESKLPGRKFDVHAVSVGLRVQRVE